MVQSRKGVNKRAEKCSLYLTILSMCIIVNLARILYSNKKAEMKILTFQKNGGPHLCQLKIRCFLTLGDNSPNIFSSFFFSFCKVVYSRETIPLSKE